MSSYQESRVLKALRSAGSKGMANYQFHGIRVLSHTKVISRLREEGYNIVTHRDQLPNGRYTNVYRYILIEPKISNWRKLLKKLMS